ncbi:hypothetical protein VNO78_08426 [Psophocarpus tetragonolobus]|uniref:Transmembrane protein n=1 Tax=Psophocarpus tetragonolobus TaxID=3891 RepID=A0AAN9XSZ8_PSOTE
MWKRMVRGKLKKGKRKETKRKGKGNGVGRIGNDVTYWGDTPSTPCAFQRSFFSSFYILYKSLTPSGIFLISLSHHLLFFIPHFVFSSFIALLIKPLTHQLQNQFLGKPYIFRLLGNSIGDTSFKERGQTCHGNSRQRDNKVRAPVSAMRRAKDSLAVPPHYTVLSISSSSFSQPLLFIIALSLKP